jgi:hypothetical protein
LGSSPLDAGVKNPQHFEILVLMGDHPLTVADAHRYWQNVRGKIVAGWDADGTPTDWRTLEQDTTPGSRDS